MPNNKQGSGQSNQDSGRQSQGAQGGYGNTSREAGGSQQGREMGRDQKGQDGSLSGGRSTGGQTDNEDDM